MFSDLDEVQLSYLFLQIFFGFCPMVWIHTFNIIFLFQIISSVLKHYQSEEALNGEEDRSTSHHNWVDEIVRCEGRGGGTVSSDISPRNTTVRLWPNTRDASTLTRSDSTLIGSLYFDILKVLCMSYPILVRQSQISFYISHFATQC